jgi:ABC-type Fe3+-citrate transport system substrate-binding protein
VLKTYKKVCIVLICLLVPVLLFTGCSQQKNNQPKENKPVQETIVPESP